MNAWRIRNKNIQIGSTLRGNFHRIAKIFLINERAPAADENNIPEDFRFFQAE